MLDARPSQMKLDVAPVEGPLPRVNTTPMHELLSCLISYVKKPDFRIGVAEFADGTGAIEGDSQSSRALTQRPDMMMTVALARGGVNLVNRNSIAVAEWELKNAMEKKLGEGRSVDSENQKVDFRPVKAGSFLGSTHYVSGAITEMNWNISSSLAEGGAYNVSAGRRTYRISIAIDVLVTNTITTEIVHARSYKKQLVGYEVTAGVFRFVQVNPLIRAASLLTTGSLELFSANVGQKQNEPVQAAVRWLIELSAYDVIRSLTSVGEKCDENLPPDTLEIKPARQSIVVASAPATARPNAQAAPGSDRPVGRQSGVGAGANAASAQGGGRGQEAAANMDLIEPPPSADRSRPTFAAEFGSAASEENARKSLTEMQRRYAEQLGRQRIDIVRTVGAEPYRLRVARLSQTSAGIICFRIKVAGGQCTIVDQDSVVGTIQPQGRRS